MRTKLYWVDGPWLGKMAVGPRPRGDDWLEDEISAWRLEGIDTVFSLLTSDEENDLGLKKDSAVLKRKGGMTFVSFPIPDRQVPASPTKVANTLEILNADLSSGKNVVDPLSSGNRPNGIDSRGHACQKGLGLLKQR